MNDRGNMTILAAGIAAALAATLLTAAGVAAMVTAQHRAQVAADMAAIAGAYELFGAGQACEAAAKVAAANDATLQHCVIDGLDVQVSVQVRSASAEARAGPVEDDE